ncbi:hypothetical protein 7t3_08 [Salmonella phage 7t3]|nr:hypothetical protein 7t3_08 [Salmonella phage 7t3]
MKDAEAAYIVFIMNPVLGRLVELVYGSSLEN